MNTGRYVGKHNHEETVLNTNLEAAREIVDQLRLRNIGGIIIVDFIDMMDVANQQRVMDAFDTALKQDKMRSNILKISELGLVEMTRKRTRASLPQLLTESCPTCSGDGRLKSVGTLASEVLRMVRRQVATASDVERVTLTVSSEVGSALQGPLRAGVDELIRKLGVRVNVRLDAKLPRDRSEIQITTATHKASAAAANGDTQPPPRVESPGPVAGES